MKPRMRGQALALGMLLIAAGAVAWIHLYNGGQMIAARSRLTHAADAVAYSGALLQARAFNMHAYINRAQVAHQVAMGHLATLASWAQFGDAQGRQSARANPPASLIGMLFGPGYGTAYAAAGGALGLGASVHDSGVLAQAYAAHDRAVHDILAASSRALIDSLPRAREAGMRQVLAANFREPRQAHEPADAVLARAGLELSVRAQGPAGGVAMHRVQRGAGLRALVDDAASRYGFLAPRNDTARNTWAVSARCPHLRHELRRRGETVLKDDGTWQSGDTQSFHALRSNRWIGCYYREYPMGWGLQHAAHGPPPEGYEHVVEPPRDFSSQPFWRWVRERAGWDLLGGSANPLADSHAVAGAARWTTRGLPAYASLAVPASAAAVPLAVVLRQGAPALATTDAASRVRIGPGAFAYRGLSGGQAVTVASAAETYFVRPEGRTDGQAELASLFHPYWQARLAPAPVGMPLLGGAR